MSADSRCNAEAPAAKKSKVYPFIKVLTSVSSTESRPGDRIHREYLVIVPLVCSYSGTIFRTANSSSGESKYWCTLFELFLVICFRQYALPDYRCCGGLIHRLCSDLPELRTPGKGCRDDKKCPEEDAARSHQRYCTAAWSIGIWSIEHTPHH